MMIQLGEYAQWPGQCRHSPDSNDEIVENQRVKYPDGKELEKVVTKKKIKIFAIG